MDMRDWIFGSGQQGGDVPRFGPLPLGPIPRPYTPGPMLPTGLIADPEVKLPAAQEGYGPDGLDLLSYLEKINQQPQPSGLVADPQGQVPTNQEGYGQDDWLRELLMGPAEARDIIWQRGGKHPVQWLTGPDIPDYIGEATGSPEAVQDAERVLALGKLAHLFATVDRGTDPPEAWRTITKAFPEMVGLDPLTSTDGGAYWSNPSVGGAIFVDEPGTRSFQQDILGQDAAAAEREARKLLIHELGHAVDKATQDPARTPAEQLHEVPTLGRLGSRPVVDIIRTALGKPELARRLEERAAAGQDAVIRYAGGAFNLSPDELSGLVEILGGLLAGGYAPSWVATELPAWAYELGYAPLRGGAPLPGVLEDARGLLRAALEARASGLP